MTTRTIEYSDLDPALRDVVDQALAGRVTLVTKNGKAVARLAPLERAEPAHRANEPRRGITLAPEHEATDVHIDRLTSQGAVPRNMRELPSR